MTTLKITVSLPEELVEQARRGVELGVAPSVSAYVADALRRKPFTEEELLADLHASLDRSGGPPTPEEEAWLDSIFNT